MSAALSAGKTLLEADVTLLATATGGVYDLTELGRLGLNRSNSAAASAWDSTGIIKPCLVIKTRSSLPLEGLGDDAAQIVAQREMLEVWAYADGSYTPIQTMLDRVFVLWQGRQLGGFVCRWAGNFAQTFDIELDAFVQRADYAVVSLK